MTRATLGFSFLLEREARIAPSLASDFVSLVTSEGWGQQLRYFSFVADPGMDPPRKRGMLRPTVLREVVEQVISASETNMVTMASSARTDDRHAACVLDTQETLVCRPQISGRRPWSPEETHASWLEEVLAFADRAPTSLGVVFTMLDQFDVSREEDILRSRAPGDSSHACFSQWLRMSRCRREVGTRYVRFPRWGTLYSHAHVAQLGGTAKIVEAVRPAVVREFGLGVYFQLTESFDSAMSEESLAKQGAFETLAAPLLPPA